MELNTQKMITKILDLDADLVKKIGIDVSKDNFRVVQPFDDGNAIILEVEGEGEDRKIKAEVNDATLVLPKIDGTLDIFVSEDEQPTND